MSQFTQFHFPEAITRALADLGYERPTPIQAKAIPLVMNGMDVLGTAQTGTGKTAAFALPLIARMLEGKHVRSVLIVAPTRELAEQTGQVLAQLTSHAPQLKLAVIIGGLAYHHQIRALRSNPAFVVGTPGRLIDQVGLGHLRLEDFGALVIDEADRLLDMGFEPQMNQIVARLPKNRQTLLFSATLPEDIVRLAQSYMKNPARVEIGAVTKPVDRIRQEVIETTAKQKDETLLREIDKVAGSILVFTKTKFRTEKVAKILTEAGHEVARIHGDRSQAQRSHALSQFRDGKARILVATDIAARGIDVNHIEHVINFDLPMCPEDYIHRIGRTARAGNDGHSLAFVTPEEMRQWGRIFKLMNGRFPNEPKGGRGQSGRNSGGGSLNQGAKPVERRPFGKKKRLQARLRNRDEQQPAPEHRSNGKPGAARRGPQSSRHTPAQAQTHGKHRSSSRPPARNGRKSSHASR